METIATTFEAMAYNIRGQLGRMPAARGFGPAGKFFCRIANSNAVANAMTGDALQAARCAVEDWPARE